MEEPVPYLMVISPFIMKVSNFIMSDEYICSAERASIEKFVQNPTKCGELIEIRK
jgi:hypothetical protein